MQVTFHPPKKNSLECSIDIVFSISNYADEFNKRLIKATKNTKMFGFRPGKIPLSVMEEKYGESVRWDIINENMQNAYRNALEKESIHPAGTAYFDKINVDDLEKTAFTAKLEILPTIEIVDLKKLKLDRKVAKVEAGDIDSMLERMQKNLRSWSEKVVGAKSENGDQVIIDFHGKLVDGTEFAGNEAKDFPVVLGEKTMLPEFEEALFNCSIDEQKSVKFSFPKQYQEPSLQGKEAIFNITVKKINSSILPKVEDGEFVKNNGVASGKMEELKEKIEHQLKGQLQGMLDRENSENLYKVLIKEHPFPIPKASIEKELDLTKQDMLKQNPKLEFDDKLLSTLEEQSADKCRLGFIFRKLQETMQFKIDPNFVEVQLQQMAMNYYGDPSKVDKLRNDPTIMSDIQSMSLQNQLIDKIYSLAKVNEKGLTFAEYTQSMQMQK